jgi:diguanylate cyclase (GGDEF)-like protein
VKKPNDITLLYVEDDYQTQEKIQLLLEDEVKELYQAFNGADALEFYYTKKPDIVVTDINMPYMDGLSFAQKIKKINEDQPIIIISGYDNKENLLKSIDIGIDYFLPKPLDIELLLEKIEKILAKIDEREHLIEEKDDAIYKMAYYDNLTGINNRHFFEQNLQRSFDALKKSNKFLILFYIDVDDFKTINDTYGHYAGDMVLEKLVQNIKTVLREEDIFCRIGGDEFAIIIENISDTNKAKTIAQKIMNSANFMVEFNMDVPNFLNNYDTKICYISCSIGACIASEKCHSKEELLHCADSAMYEIKNSGKANYRLSTECS